MRDRAHAHRIGTVAAARSARRTDRSRCLFILIGAALAAAATPYAAYAQLAQISNLSDVGFGTISTLTADVSQSQTVCVYTSSVPARYTIAATGSGAAGAFTLTNGATTLPYEVQWSAAPNQTSGTMLSPGAGLSGLTSPGLTPTCTLGITPSGSLTVILRAGALSSASAGAFSGTLSLTISPN